MIAKMSSSNTLYSALAYNQNKVDDAHAKIIFANKMIESADGNYDINSCLRSFEPYLLANQRTEKPVLHGSINPDPKDIHNADKMSFLGNKMSCLMRQYVAFFYLAGIVAIWRLGVTY
jgi:hypothetical protein